MSDYFDLARIGELQEVMGSEAGTIVASMLASLTAAIAQVEAAVPAGELDRATQAAHAARNDALMLSAGPLQRALTDLEAAARDGDEAGTRSALTRVQEVWPVTRDGLAAAAAH